MFARLGCGWVVAACFAVKYGQLVHKKYVTYHRKSSIDIHVAAELSDIVEPLRLHVRPHMWKPHKLVMKFQ